MALGLAHRVRALSQTEVQVTLRAAEGYFAPMNRQVDFLVIGTGLAGLTFALKMADRFKVLLVAKTTAQQTNTSMAQGGIAAVISTDDSVEQHVQDTLKAGAGLCREDIVRLVVKQSAERIEDLVRWGLQFDHAEGSTKPDLTREGGHSRRRILHVQDHTGAEIQRQLMAVARNTPGIEILEDHMAIDLITNKKINPQAVGPTEVLGAYFLERKTERVLSIGARATILATGGAGKAYLYTSNWEGATGDGIAMAHRAGARVANMEFMQFHPTCLYHPTARNFLISEALRGEGAELVNGSGVAFMKKHHPQGALAPRDIVARGIDAEMKSTGAECVYLDITHQPADEVRRRFPMIHDRCLEYGIDITRQPIPVVPAAHYLCGGVLTDSWGRTDLNRLFVIGESACSGLHGANRLASNSLLECTVFAHQASVHLAQHLDPLPQVEFPEWQPQPIRIEDELVVISHMWDEIRRLMWNYVGILRSNRRLERALHRIENIRNEITTYYWNFRVHPDILELRNIADVAHLTVLCALMRKESRGIHYNIDFENQIPTARDSIT